MKNNNIIIYLKNKLIQHKNLDHQRLNKIYQTIEWKFDKIDI